MERSLEKKFYTAIFLDGEQAFDKVWHKDLIDKLNKNFQNNMQNSYFHTFLIDYLGPILYLLYTRDLLEMDDVTVATSTDDTALPALGHNVDIFTNKLQEAGNKIYKCTKY